jgi:hypothetical protein
MNWYAILTAVGIVVLLLGLAMSPTETQTTTTCVDSGYQYGSGCIDTTYEAPNPARGLFVGGGFFLALVAGSLWVKNRGITTKPRDDVGPVRQPQSSHTPQNGPSAGPDAGTDPTTADPDDDKPTTSADGEYQRLYHRHRRVSAMENVELERSLPDTIDTAKLAFELTDGIETYHQSGNRIVGKTGVSFGSYGETVVVDCKTLSEEDPRTLVTVVGERSVDVNITANPDKYVQRYLGSLRTLETEPMADVLRLADDHIADNGSKEVTSADQQADGSWLLYVVVAGTLFLFFLMFAAI